MPFVAVKSSILIRESVGTDSFSPPALSGTAAPHRLNFFIPPGRRFIETL